jgi:hypothetical protein
MLFNIIIHCIAILATAVTATQDGCPAPVGTAVKTFKLKTTGSANAAHNNLYVEDYHTGAGTADPVLSANPAVSPAWQLNNTEVIFVVNDAPYGFVMAAPINYASKHFYLQAL